MSAEDLCQVRVNRGRSGPWMGKLVACGRPVERDGKCKLHLRVQENRAKKDAEQRERWDRNKALQEEADVLGAALGTHVVAHWDTSRSYYDGRFVVDGDWLRGVVSNPDDDPQESVA